MRLERLKGSQESAKLVSWVRVEECFLTVQYESGGDTEHSFYSLCWLLCRHRIRENSNGWERSGWSQEVNAAFPWAVTVYIQGSSHLRTK